MGDRTKKINLERPKKRKRAIFNPANTLTLLRVVWGFAVFILLVYFMDSTAKVDERLAAVVIFSIIMIHILDWVDGFVARKTNSSTDFGSIIDIAGDRAIEIMFFFAFACLGLVSKIIPVIFLIRGQITDTLRCYILKEGKTPYKGFHKKGSLGQFLTASRLMRGISGLSKFSTFLLAAVVVSFKVYEWYYLVNILAWFALVVNIVRGIYPILDGIKQAEELLEYV